MSKLNIDEIYAELQQTMGGGVPARSAVEVCVRAVERRLAVRDADTAAVMTVLSETGITFDLGGGGQGRITKLGGDAAVDILARLKAIGVRLVEPRAT